MQSADDLDPRLRDEPESNYTIPVDIFDHGGSEDTMPLSRVANMAQSDTTFPTGVLSDFEEYTDSSEDLDSFDLSDDDILEPTDVSMPSLPSEKYSASSMSPQEIREATMSRGALIRRKYYGRY